jgi:hypothetical protein
MKSVTAKARSTLDPESYSIVKDRSSPTCVGLAAPKGRSWSAAPARRARIGGADRDRTDDLRLAKPALSQLSYSPVESGGPG